MAAANWKLWKLWSNQDMNPCISTSRPGLLTMLLNNLTDNPYWYWLHKYRQYRYLSMSVFMPGRSINLGVCQPSPAEHVKTEVIWCTPPRWQNSSCHLPKYELMLTMSHLQNAFETWNLYQQWCHNKNLGDAYGCQLFRVSTSVSKFVPSNGQCLILSFRRWLCLSWTTLMPPSPVYQPVPTLKQAAVCDVCCCQSDAPSSALRSCLSAYTLPALDKVTWVGWFQINRLILPSGCCQTHSTSFSPFLGYQNPSTSYKHDGVRAWPVAYLGFSKGGAKPGHLLSPPPSFPLPSPPLPLPSSPFPSPPLLSPLTSPLWRALAGLKHLLDL